MKGAWIGGVVTGALLGAAVWTAAASMMDTQTKRKITRFAEQSGRRVAEKANELFGR